MKRPGVTHSLWLAAAAATVILVAGCRTVYYSTMESFGVHKRDLLVRNVVAARDAQEAAKNQFSSALERFSSVLGFDGGELEEKHEALEKELKRSEAKADVVRERIDDVEGLSTALFREWRKELSQYSSAELRSASKAKLEEAEAQYERLLSAMRRAIVRSALSSTRTCASPPSHASCRRRARSQPSFFAAQRPPSMPSKR